VHTSVHPVSGAQLPSSHTDLHNRIPGSDKSRANVGSSRKDKRKAKEARNGQVKSSGRGDKTTAEGIRKQTIEVEPTPPSCTTGEQDNYSSEDEGDDYVPNRNPFECLVEESG
jgi:hypothetical protein